ncbi:uncharacterized protein [Physcomitrium patens]|uniref:BRX domain-containing protein n=1 Tax=Physcomitrium patens TaxID=3218 RepID=A0A2K1JHB4_PHYPA|nr:protein Brevis radix-like 4 isoform X1 [Physcomitrium patens]PNR40945.1 hypothetical protein PHYPA_018348 [Physcomitrium patens]|eukprot:XP_024393729.1 protein Brevis radix-like 4 isoform X1 [Physcomitrella patens]
MAVKMLACMSSKTLEEAVEADYEKDKTSSKPETKSDLRKMKSFTCQTLIHPSWSFKSQGNQGVSPPLATPPQASRQSEGKEEVASGKPDGKGWKSFFAALQCSRAPLRSSDFKGMAAKLTAGACTTSCKPCSTSVSEQDAAHAVHPEASLDKYSEADFSLPVANYRNPNVLTDDQGNNLGSNNGDGSGSPRSAQAVSPEQKINSKTPTPIESPVVASYHMSNGTALKIPEEPQNLNRLMPAEPGVPGTEWFSQVELGVFITFVTLPNGCNALKRIRFSRDIFSKKEAESWWAENGNRVREVYNVPAFERTTTNGHQATSSSEEEQVSGVSGYATPSYSPQGSRGASTRDSPAGYSSGISRGASLRDTSSREASMREPSIRESIRQSMRDAVSEHSESATCTERETETDTVAGSVAGSDRTYDGEESTWVEEDVPGVYLTLKNLTGGGRELKRVRFSREKFTEKQAKIWWDENRGRIHKQYL